MKINWYRNLRMRTQILLFSLIIILFVFAIQLLIMWINITLLQNLIQEQSAVVMSRENFNGLNGSLSLITKYIQRQQSRTISKISSIDGMHQLVQNINNLQTYQSYLSNCNASLLFENPQAFCYLIYNETYFQSSPNSLDNYFSLVQQLDSFILSFYDAYANHDQIYLADNSDCKFTAYFPPFYLQKFDAQQSFVYKYHMEYIKSHPNQKYVYPLSEALPNAQGFISVFNSITTSLHTSNNTLNGMTGITFLPLQQYYDEIPYNILFINSQEEIQMASVEWRVDYSKKNYIFNRDNSGFGQEDWNQIYRLSQHENFISNCSQRIKIGSLCRYNSLLEKEVLIQSYNFQADNSTLVIMQNITTQKIVDQQISQVIDSLISQNLQIMIVQIASTAISSIISLILIQQISRSFSKIMKLSTIFVRCFGNNINRKLFYIFRTQGKRRSVQSKLEETLYKFHDSFLSSKTKCRQCRDIEKFSYHKNNIIGNFESTFKEQIKDELNQLKNNSNNEYLSYYWIKQILFKSII